LRGAALACAALACADKYRLAVMRDPAEPGKDLAKTEKRFAERRGELGRGHPHDGVDAARLTRFEADLTVIGAHELIDDGQTEP
jgi:hypothetical protein